MVAASKKEPELTLENTDNRAFQKDLIQMTIADRTLGQQPLLLHLNTYLQTNVLVVVTNPTQITNKKYLLS